MRNSIVAIIVLLLLSISSLADEVYSRTTYLISRNNIDNIRINIDHYDYREEYQQINDAWQVCFDSPEDLAISNPGLLEQIILKSETDVYNITELTPNIRVAMQLFPESYPSTKEISQEFAYLLNKVNSDDFKVRNAAKVRAKDIKFFSIARAYSRKKLTPEQSSLVDVATKGLILSDEVLDSLKNNKNYLQLCLLIPDDKIKSLVLTRIKSI